MAEIHAKFDTTELFDSIVQIIADRSYGVLDKQTVVKAIF